MKKHLAFVAFAATLVSGYPAMAGNTAQYLVQGSVPEICTVQSPTLLTTRPAVNVTELAGQTLQITQLTNQSTLATNATSFDVGFATVCGLPHYVIVQSENNGLWRDVQTTPAPGLADGVPYTATVYWGGAQTSFYADATAKQQTSASLAINEGAVGDIDLHFQIEPGASNGDQAYAPLLAGTYRDTIRVTVVPQ